MGKLCIVVAARPNFVKMAPVILEARRRQIPQFCVHTDQHYDREMSEVFFEDLGMPRPDIHLGVRSASHAEQTARVMVAFEKVCVEHAPDLIVVGGDVNSTLACALVGAKLLIPVAHVEAGLRSFDRTMPEEVNRVLTDHLSSLLFTTEESGNENLVRECIPKEIVHFVGNSMIDSLRAHVERAVERKPWEKMDLQPGEFGIVTLHRPANVDFPDTLREIGMALREIAAEVPLVFPVHPRTRDKIERLGSNWAPIRLVEPLGYLDFLGLMAKSRIVLTDSGGIQEETTALGVQCVTMRPNTERPVTIEAGTNRLAGAAREDIVRAATEALQQNSGAAVPPPLWDGQAAGRIIDVIEKWFLRRQLSTEPVSRVA